MNDKMIAQFYKIKKRERRKSNISAASLGGGGRFGPCSIGSSLLAARILILTTPTLIG